MYLTKPEFFNIFKTFFLGNIIYNNNSMCSFIIGPSDGPESLLPSGIPDLQFDDITIHSYWSKYFEMVLESKINTDCGQVTLLEWIICKSTQYWWFPYWTIAHDYYFE